MSCVDKKLSVACPLQLQMMLVGMKFRLKGAQMAEVVELMPNGVMNVWVGEERREDVWGEARANGLVLGGRTMKAIEMDIAFDRSRCCQIDRLVGRSAGGVVGVCIHDANEAMHLERCPTARTSATRIEVFVDGSKFFRKFQMATVAGLNEFLEILQTRISTKDGRVRLHVVGSAVKTAWHCTPILSASRVTREDIECDVAKSVAVGRPFFDGLGQTLNALSIDQKRIVCVLTDGLDTSSQIYARAGITRTVRRHRQAGWTFLCLSLYNAKANFTGESIGVAPETCATLRATPAGVRSALKLAAMATGRIASGQSAAFFEEERIAGFHGLLSCTSADEAARLKLTPSTAKIELVIDGSTITNALRHVAVNCLNNLIEALRDRLPSSIPIQLHTFGKLVKARWRKGTLLGNSPRVFVDDLPSFTANDKSALLDALAITLSPPSSTEEDAVAAVSARIVLILTGGRDTASRLYTADEVRSLIEARRENGWIFIWVTSESPRSNLTGPGLGIDQSTCTRYRDGCASALRAAFSRATSSIVRAASGNSPAFPLNEVDEGSM